ncbi:MAG: ferrochelatase [Myxococcales bacterium]|nr:ferrochelatase [Myxococcales bacterium]
MPEQDPYDALLVVSFGGPEAPQDVMPFLRRVVQGRGVPDERLAAVAEHYHALGGKSPINDQCRDLIAALGSELQRADIGLPIYWGNRNWDPLLVDTLETMRDDGVRHALAYVTSAFSSYSGCRQYLENIEAARAQLGPDAPRVSKLRGFFNHPRFVELMAERVRDALAELPEDARERARLVFTAHSIPNAMAAGCAYQAQLSETAALVTEALGRSQYDLAYQSRSGPPQVPWLEPDILDHLRALAGQGVRDVVVLPLGFVSDHMEVVWDLDHEARELAANLGLRLARAATAGSHPLFVTMLRELVEERLGRRKGRASLGVLGALPDSCRDACCAYTPRRPGPSVEQR